MRVKEIMTKNAKACTPTTTLAEAAGLMWDEDCGVVPVVTEAGQVIGLVTDRDICMAAALSNRKLSDLAVEEVVSGTLYSTKPDDDVRTALDTMKEQRVRRLPVINSDGALEGILSMNDLVLNAQEGREKGAISFHDVLDTIKAISSHRLPVGKKKEAAARV
ncbi:MAG TPA: CBS domain-containing protein [Pyrinomonadaceae bacterium]|nr:CBS domain-containing protein [Pyrinomonadaceae bacterium]